MASFIIIPLMTFIALSKTNCYLLLTEKWIALIPLLQWMVLPVFLPMSAINMNVLNAMGRSDLF
jgi:O-antigen/teichoic acid export membrane protein